MEIWLQIFEREKQYHGIGLFIKTDKVLLVALSRVRDKCLAKDVTDLHKLEQQPRNRSCGRTRVRAREPKR